MVRRTQISGAVDPHINEFHGAQDLLELLPASATMHGDQEAGRGRNFDVAGLSCPLGLVSLHGSPLGNLLALNFRGTLQRRPPLDEPDEQGHDCKDQEQVDVATEGIGTDHT